MLKKQSDALPELHLKSADTGRKWFTQKPYFLIPLGLLVIYSLMAAESAELLALANKMVTPLVDSLYYVGLGVVKPFINGSMPERYYANLVGIGVWAVVAYNVRTVIWVISRNWWHVDFVTINTKLAQKQMNWSARRTWAVQRLSMVLGIFPITAYALLSLLNSMHGWIVFQVKDLLTPILLIVTFQAAGMFFCGLLTLLATFLFHDLRHLLKITSRKEKQ